MNYFFSVIICTYNSSKYICETIDSVINQNFKEYEIVIVDDFSTDDTKNKLEKYKNFKNISIYYNNKNRGYPYSRDLAISKSKGHWITILDHDDLFTKNRLIEDFNEISSNSKINFFFGNSIYFSSYSKFNRYELFYKTFGLNVFDLNQKKISSSNNLLKYGCYIVSSTVTFSKQAYLNVGEYNSKYSLISDYDLFYRFSLIYDFFCSNNIKCYWRMHSKQFSNNEKKMYYELIIFIISKFIDKKIYFSTKLYLIVLLIKNILKLILSFFMLK